MVEFAGFHMPLEYEGLKKEHVHVREKAGVFDVSHMGELWIKGEGAYELVQHLTSNDISLMKPGSVQYTCFPNERGGIVDDLLVYCYPGEKYLLVVNAANLEKDLNWVLDHNHFGAVVENASDRMAQLAVQGPLASRILQKLTAIHLGDIPYYHFQTGEFAGVSEVIVSNTGYTGSGGFELYMDVADGPLIWEQLMEVGKEFDLKPAGLAARDTLRLEMGFCLYGNDIDEQHSPLEAGLGWITRFVEGNDFINREALEQQKANGVDRRLVGFEMLERGIPRQHYPILDENGRELGEVTSGTMSPMLNKGIGMAYVTAEKAKAGTEIWIGVRNKRIAARVCKMPFYKV